MEGLELCRRYFEAYGLPLLEGEFASQRHRICAGLVGRGSECFGFDDALSRDHDFAPRFYFFLTDEDEASFGFSLMRAYSRLPKAFGGIEPSAQSLSGCVMGGVQTIGDFYENYTGRRGAPTCWQDWFYTPSHYFAEATNGEIFCDPLGEFTAVREQILHGMPEDVRRKKLSAHLAAMAQSGQYNYDRCLAHGEKGAAVLALHEFVLHTAKALFLLHHAHTPYYKWMLRSLRTLPDTKALADRLQSLLLCPENARDGIEEICADMVLRLREQQLSARNEAYLEPHAYAVAESIRTPAIRLLHLMDTGE